MHPPQQLTAKADSAHCDDHAKDRRERDRRVNRILYSLFFFRAKILRHDHAGSDRQPLAERDQKADDRSTRPDCRKRVASHKISHDNGVHGIVQLLQQITQNQRHRKEKYFLRDAAFCHKFRLIVIFHFLSP